MEPNPFPLIFPGLTLAQQRTLQALEHNIVQHTPKTLVIVEQAQLLPLLSVSIDRLLRFAVHRILILSGIAPLKPELLHWWTTGTSPFDAQRLCHLYPAQYTATWPPAPEIRVCISTLREIQASLYEAENIPIDLVLIYRPIASHVLQRVLSTFPVPCVGWSAREDEHIHALFDGSVLQTGKIHLLPHL